MEMDNLNFRKLSLVAGVAFVCVGTLACQVPGIARKPEPTAEALPTIRTWLRSGERRGESEKAARYLSRATLCSSASSLMEPSKLSLPATALINRVRHQEDATPSRTLRENTEAEGRQVMAYLEQRATIILQEHGLTAGGAPTEAATDRVHQTLVTWPPEQVERAVRACAPEPEWVAEMARNPVAYEDPTPSTHVALDFYVTNGQSGSVWVDDLQLMVEPSAAGVAAATPTAAPAAPPTAPEAATLWR